MKKNFISKFSLFSPVSLTLLINIHSRISQRIFEKIWNGPNGPGGRWFMKKIWCRKSCVILPLSVLPVYNVNTLYFNAHSFPEKSAKIGNLSTIKTQCPNQLSCSRIRWSLVWRWRERKSLSLIQGLWIWPLVAMGHKITNVPLILKICGDYFLFLGKLLYGPFRGIFWGGQDFFDPLNCPGRSAGQFK
jgi:hypothetical protein